MEGRIDMLDFIWNIISSDKFYLPVIFIFIGIVSYKIISKTVKKVGKFNNYIGKGHSKGYDKRRDTVIGLINNIIKYIIAIIVVILILNLYGVNTRSIVASIGIAGAIIGLAFQDIIKDFLAGVFIIFDNEYAVGDWIKIDDFRGEVISIGLKTTKIRAYTGEIMILSNSSFNKIINYNLNPPSIYIQIPFGYDEKIEKIEEEEKAEEKRKRDGEIDVLINELISQIDALEDEKKRIDGKISSIRFEIMKLEEEKKA